MDKENEKEEKGEKGELQALRDEVAALRARLEETQVSFYASSTSRNLLLNSEQPQFPTAGIPPSHARNIIWDYHNMDSNEYLNTSSYVNVVFEPEEVEVATLGMSINIADQTVYPVTFRVHDYVVNMIANLWNCPESDVYQQTGVHAGAGTVGSTEACLLAGLALKFRWRRWYAKKHNLTEEEVVREVPNIVISSMYQAAWEKLFKYMDIQPRLVKPSYKTMTLDAKEAEKLIDDHTIGVVCILGNHYSGHYDPVDEVDAMLSRVNKDKGYQVGIHVDGASGAFIAPFQPEMKEKLWDFRLPNVLSISASGHKFGESICGTGWVVWRQKEDLSEHVAISVTYLGGCADSYTLNFSRPASGILVQFYKILRLGVLGYTSKVANQMKTANLIRFGLSEMEFKGKKRFVILDAGAEGCLPVVTAMLNPELSLPFDDIDLQHAISDEHWYVSGYRMRFHDPVSKGLHPLFTDIKGEQTMFRVVVKSNLTLEMGQSLVSVIERAVNWLDQHMLREQQISSSSLSSASSGAPRPPLPFKLQRRGAVKSQIIYHRKTHPGMGVAPSVRAFTFNPAGDADEHGHQAC